MDKLLSHNNKIVIGLLFFILLAGFGLRLWGISWGHPEISYIDAGATIRPAKRIAYNILNKKFDIDPQYYYYPNLFHNLLATEFVIYGLIMTKCNRGNFSYKEKLDTLFHDEKNFYKFEFLARITSAIAGTLTILFVFFLAMAAYGEDKRIGLISALFLAFMYLHVKDCKYPMTDAIMALFSTIALIYIVKILFQNNLKAYILAGLFIGLGISTKYLPASLILPFLMVIGLSWFYNRKNSNFFRDYIKKSIIGVVCIALGFLIGTPMFIPRFKPFTARLMRTKKSNVITAERKAEGYKAKLGQVQQGYFDLLFSTTPNFNEPLCLNSVRGAMDMPLLLLTLAGLFFSLYIGLTKHTKQGAIDIVFVTFIIVYYFFLAEPTKLRVVRYLYIMLPLYAVIAARFLTQAVDYLRIARIKKLILLIVLAVIFVYPTAARSIQYSHLMSHTDTRIFAREWIEENIAEGSTILMANLYPVKLSPKKYKVLFYSKQIVRKKQGLPPAKVFKDQYNVDYVITSSYFYIRYYLRESQIDYPEVTRRQINFYKSLDKDGKLIKVFENNEWDKPGPTIKIYKL